MYFVFHNGPESYDPGWTVHLQIEMLQTYTTLAPLSGCRSPPQPLHLRPARQDDGLRRRSTAAHRAPQGPGHEGSGAGFRHHQKSERCPREQGYACAGMTWESVLVRVRVHCERLECGVCERVERGVCRDENAVSVKKATFVLVGGSKSVRACTHFCV